jgi:hypothetical protein
MALYATATEHMRTRSFSLSGCWCSVGRRERWRERERGRTVWRKMIFKILLLLFLFLLLLRVVFDDDGR